MGDANSVVGKDGTSTPVQESFAYKDVISGRGRKWSESFKERY